MDKLFVAGGRRVACLSAETGEELWRSKVPAAGGICQVHYLGTRLYVMGGGKISAVDPENGHVLWTNNLKGMGFQVYGLTGVDGNGQGLGSSGTAAQSAATAAMAVATMGAGAAV